MLLVKTDPYCGRKNANGGGKRPEEYEKEIADLRKKRVNSPRDMVRDLMAGGVVAEMGVEPLMILQTKDKVETCQKSPGGS